MLALRCYRCGTDLGKLTLPLSRRDLCPDCGVDLHVCLMCSRYDPRVPEQCTEEDAVEVREKARANFCDYFVPNEAAFAPGRMTAQQRAETELEALFGAAPSGAAQGADGPEPAAGDGAAHDAEALFKR